MAQAHLVLYSTVQYSTVQYSTAGTPGVVPQPRPRPAPRPRARVHQLRGEAAVGAPQQPHVTPAQRPGHVAVPGQDTELGTA